MTEYRIAPYTPLPALVIQGRHDKEIGRLDLTCEPAKFTGDVDESARVLFECVIALHSGRIKELEAELEQAHAAVLYYITIKSGLEAERDAAREEADRNRVNAERYEWLRNKAESTNDDMPIVAARTPQDTTMLVAGKLDAAIDAARIKP